MKAEKFYMPQYMITENQCLPSLTDRDRKLLRTSHAWRGPFFSVRNLEVEFVGYCTGLVAAFLKFGFNSRFSNNGLRASFFKKSYVH